VVSRLTVDRSSPVPLYFQVAQELQRLIDTDALPAGTRLINEIEFADRLGVSRPTMRRAIQYLVDRGLLVRKRGVGTQVVRSQVNRSLELTSLYDDLEKAGRKPRTEVLASGMVEADEVVVEALGLPAGSEVFELRRLRYADGEPIALMTNYLPAGLIDVEPEVFATTGLYELIRSAGYSIRVADQNIGATNAPADIAALLHEKKGAALITMRRVAYDDEGVAVEYGTHVYRSSRYSFSLTLVER
jgi:DNA-binding GntR family transcriptional regulator